MNDRRLVETMRSRDPAAMGAVYDNYAGRLFAFCWFLLRSREAAEVALRDTLIVAAAHIGKLRDPDRLAAWLYAIARVECARRPAPPERRPDMPIASHDQDDVDQRVMAWGAVMGLPRLTGEVLELLLRHRFAVPDVAAVLAVPPKEVEAALARSRAELQVALTAELLAHEGPYGCAGRAAILRAREGELTSALRTRLRRHAEECETCGKFLIGAVAPAKVYGLLPYATPARGLRQRVLKSFVDPELTNYRDFVAGRVDGFAKSGFSVQRHRGWDRRTPYDPVGDAVGRWRRLLHVIGGLAATAAIVGAVVALVRWAGYVQDQDAGRALALRATPSVRAQPTPLRPPGRSDPAPGGDNGDASSSAPALSSDPSDPSGTSGCDPAAPPFAQSSPLDDHLRGLPSPPGGATHSTATPRPTGRVTGPAAPPSGTPTGPTGPPTGPPHPTPSPTAPPSPPPATPPASPPGASPTPAPPRSPSASPTSSSPRAPSSSPRAPSSSPRAPASASRTVAPTTSE
jgi:DNA-directed RNA polymerase specialized sigma24 family protein